jgi:simple sugar transport system permease protein
MLNAIAMGVFAYLLSEDVVGVRTGDKVATPQVPDSGRVPGISLGGAGTLYGMIVVSIVVGVAYWVVMNRTRLGFEIKATGESPTAAAAGGVSAKRLVVVAMLSSGAVAGLTGLPELLGRTYEVAQNFPSEYGFTGIAIALLGRNHPVGVAIGALLWAFLDRSALALDNIDVPQELATIMQGVIVISVIVAYQVVKRWNLAAQRRQVGEATGTEHPTHEPASSGGAR